MRRRGETMEPNVQLALFLFIKGLLIVAIGWTLGWQAGRSKR
jgi:hypothetical protein